MHVAYPYMPDIHNIVDTPVARYLRRETKQDCLICYWFTDTYEDDAGREKERIVWVVSLFDGIQLLDVGHLGNGKGEGAWSSAENAQAIIKRLAVLITAAEAKRRLRHWKMDEDGKMNDMAQRHHEAHTRMYFAIKARRGVMKANDYAHHSAPELIDGGPWSVTGVS